MSVQSIDNRTSSSTATVHEIQATPARRITVVLADDHRSQSASCETSEHE